MRSYTDELTTYETAAFRQCPGTQSKRNFVLSFDAVELELHPEAREELVQAADWYAEHELHVAEHFVAAVEDVFRALARNPNRWPEQRQFGVRRVRLKKFPFSIFYDFDDSTITVFAVAHTKRKPGYWIKRR